MWQKCSKRARLAQRIMTYVNRAGLKPMQPMRLHWAPRFWGPRAKQVVSFLPDTPCAREISKNGLWILLLANNHLVWTNDEFPPNWTLSNLFNSHATAFHHVFHFVDGTWLLLVPVKTAIDFQILQTRCVVIQFLMNRSRPVSAALNLMAVPPTQHCSILERSCFGTLNALSWMCGIYILTKTCIYISRQILT